MKGRGLSGADCNAVNHTNIISLSLIKESSRSYIFPQPNRVFFVVIFHFGTYVCLTVQMFVYLLLQFLFEQLVEGSDEFFIVEDRTRVCVYLIVRQSLKYIKID